MYLIYHIAVIRPACTCRRSSEKSTKWYDLNAVCLTVTYMVNTTEQKAVIEIYSPGLAVKLVKC